MTSVGGSCGAATGDSVTVSVTINGSPTTPATAACSSGSWTLTLASPVTAEGSDTFAATQSDTAGNTGLSGNKVVSVDTTKPTATVTFPANGGSYGTWTGSLTGAASDPISGGVSSGIAWVWYSVQQGSGNYWNGISFGSAYEFGYTASGTTTWSAAFPIDNFPADGSYTVRAYAVDLAANIQTSAAVSTFTIDRDQTITFGTLANKTYGDTPFSVTATASSGLTVTFSTTTPSVCTSGGANGATITIVATGTCTVQADQAGDTTFNAAPSVSQSFTVIPALVSIAVSPTSPTIEAGTDRQFGAIGTYSDATTADITASVTWTSASPAVATIGATTGLAHGVAAGTSGISATLELVSGSTTLTVTPATGPSCNKAWAAAADGFWSDPDMWTPSGAPSSSDDVCITADGSYTVTVNGSGAAGSVTLGASGNANQPTLRITDSSSGPGTLTSAAGFSNHGSIVLETSIGYGVTLALTTGALSNAADGSVTVNYGAGGLTTISGQVVNAGSVTITAGATLNLAGGYSFDQTAGTLTVDGSFPVTGATFIYHGGAITGSLVLSGATLELAASPASPDTFILSGTNVLTGDVPTGHTLRITDSSSGPGTLTSAAGFSNHGSIVLETSIGYGVTLALTTGALSNAADGSVTVNYGAGGLTTISGQVVNAGSVTITAGATLNLAGGYSFDQTAGTLTVDGSFPVTGATFIYHGGAITGSLVLSGATLELAASPASPDTFILSGTNVLTGDVPTGHTLRITDSSSGPGTLTSAAGFSNHGSIVLETSIGYGVTLALTTGALSNAADGSVTVNYGAGGLTTISGQVVNAGSVTITAGATLDLAGALRPSTRPPAP